MVNIKLYDTNKRLLQSLTVLIFLSGCALIFLFDPVQSPFYPPCLFKKLTGLNCPGCGSSRALHQLMHGNLLPALDYNILVVIFLPFIVVGILSFFTGRFNSTLEALNKPSVFLVIITIFWVLRNLPYYPFTALNADH